MRASATPPSHGLPAAHDRRRPDAEVGEEVEVRGREGARVLVDDDEGGPAGGRGGGGDREVGRPPGPGHPGGGGGGERGPGERPGGGHRVVGVDAHDRGDPRGGRGDPGRHGSGVADEDDLGRGQPLQLVGRPGRQAVPPREQHGAAPGGGCRDRGPAELEGVVGDEVDDGDVAPERMLARLAATDRAWRSGGRSRRTLGSVPAARSFGAVVGVGEGVGEGLGEGAEVVGDALAVGEGGAATRAPPSSRSRRTTAPPTARNRRDTGGGERRWRAGRPIRSSIPDPRAPGAPRGLGPQPLSSRHPAPPAMMGS